jgi:hypothetical protein
MDADLVFLCLAQGMQKDEKAFVSKLIENNNVCLSLRHYVQLEPTLSKRLFGETVAGKVSRCLFGREREVERERGREMNPAIVELAVEYLGLSLLFLLPWLVYLLWWASPPSLPSLTDSSVLFAVGYL